ncbi:MAG: hypothetical protein AB7O49_13240 [Sphingomonadales bacterium]
MNALIAVVGTAILGWVWLIVYNYASGFDDLFLLGSFAAATLHFPTYKAEKNLRNFFMARAHELKQCTCIVIACIAIGLMMIAPDGGIPDITWSAIIQITVTSIGAVVIVHTIGRLLWRV